MIFLVLIPILIPFTEGCPVESLPPCTCVLIGHASSKITCEAIDNEINLQNSLYSMKSSSIPIRTVEIFDMTLNYLPSKLFQGLRFKRLFIAGSSMVSLSDSDTAFVGLEDSLETLLVQEFILFSGWRWSQLRNLTSLTELETVKAGHTSIDEDIKDIAHLNIKNLLMTTDSISFIHDTAFATFGNLQVLSLKRNLIKEVKRSMLPNPAMRFEQIILSYNEIQSIPKDLFSNMPNLKSVILSGNRILTMDKLAFLPVWDHLIKIDLLDNPLRCDCRMKWLLAVSFPLTTRAHCQEPAVLNGTKLRDLTPNDLWC